MSEEKKEGAPENPEQPKMRLSSDQFEIINLLRLLGKNRDPLKIWRGKLENLSGSGTIQTGVISHLSESKKTLKIVPYPEGARFSFNTRQSLSLYCSSRKILFKVRVLNAGQNMALLYLPEKISMLPEELAAQFDRLGEIIEEDTA